MPRGRPRKKPRNRDISGLRNQQTNRLSPGLSGSPLAGAESDGTIPRSTPSRSRSRALSPDEEDENHLDWRDLANSEVGSETDLDESDWEEVEFWEGLDDEEFWDKLVEMVAEDDPKDLDWIPPKWERVSRGKSSLRIH